MVAEPENDDARRRREGNIFAERITDDLGLSPAKRAAQQGILDKQGRIDALKQYLNGCLHQLEGNPQTGKAWHHISDIRKELADAEARLAEYQAQLTGLK